jgi:hypothetical protein
MRRILTLLVFSLILSYSHAQDFIITTSGDTVDCIIKLVRPDNIYYTITVNNEPRTVSIPVSDVLSYKYKDSESINMPAEKNTFDRDYSHLKISFNTGYGYQLGKIHEDLGQELTDYQGKLKSGYQFGGSLTYFFSGYFGMGANYRSFRTSNSMNDVLLLDKRGYKTYGDISDKINISFYNVMFIFRSGNILRRGVFYAGSGLGYVEFRDKTKVIDDFLMTGGTLGTSTEIGYDIGLSDRWETGLQLTYITGLVKEYRIDDGSRVQTVKPEDKDEYINLYRLDFSIGLRFTF